MKMTQALANNLMDCLYSLAVAANGRDPKTEEEITMCQEYAEDTFLRLWEQWEETMGESWEIASTES